MNLQQAPELQTVHWFNTKDPVTLASLRGRVVAIEAFQMLCPGCVSHGLPQAQRIAATFSERDVAVIGLHTVFEHHAAQGRREALEAFLHEYRIAFPVGMDAPSDNDAVPKTMRAYGMQGTPSLLLIDRDGKLRKHWFGPEQDMVVGAKIMALIGERQSDLPETSGNSGPRGQCDERGCSI